MGTDYQTIDQYHKAFNGESLARISLANPWSTAFVEHFKKDLEEYKVSKSVIQLPNDKPLPDKLIKKIVVFRKKENEQSAKNKKK